MVGARRAGHARRRIRLEHGPVLRARHVHSDQRSDRPGESRRDASAASTTSHQRDDAAKVLDSVRETIAIGEKGGLPTQVTHAQGHGQGELGPQRRHAASGRRSAGPRRGRHDRSVSLTASSTSISSALMPAWALEGGREATLAAAEGSGAREKARPASWHDPRRARRRRSEERPVCELQLRSVASGQDARRPDHCAGQSPHHPQRRGSDDVDRRTGWVPGHLPRDERADLVRILATPPIFVAGPPNPPRRPPPQQAPGLRPLHPKKKR